MSITYNYRTGTITATTFSGALSGNASTASQWQTTRTITMSGDVSSDAVNIDGSGNITITNTAVANDSHTHDAGNLTGSTLAAGVTGSSLTSVGTITSGVWNGTALTAAYVPNHDSLNGFVANEHLDWTTDTGSVIVPDNLNTDLSYAGVSTVTPQYNYVGYDRFSGGIDNDLILDEGIFGLASGDTNGAGNGTFNPMLVMRNSSDVRVQVSFPRENSNPIAYRGYHTAAWQTWHYAGWTTTEANANLDATFAKISGTPADSQIGVWTGATSLEGTSTLTWNGGTSTLTVGTGSTTFTLGGASTGHTNYIEIGKGFDVDSGIKWNRGATTDSRIYVNSGENMFFTIDETNALSSNTFNWQANGGTVMQLDDAGMLFLDGIIELVERADHSTSPVGGRGEIWVKSGSLGGELMYTEGDQDFDFTAYNVLPVVYHHDQTTTAADPGAGNMRWNSTTPASVTNIYLDDVDETGRDNSFMLGNLADGDVLTMRNMWAAGSYFVCSVNGTPTDNTGYWTIPVTVIHSGTVPATGAPVHISVEWQSQAAGGSGTVTSVAAGNGLDFTTITTTGSVTLGTPGTTTASSSNAVTATSHTHAVDNTIRQGLTDNAAITTAGWYRIATNSASAGRGGATIYITNSGGGDSPDPTMIRIQKSYGGTLSDASITVVSSVKQGSSSLDGVRIIFDQVTNNEIHVEVNIGTGSSSTWTHYIVPDNTLGTWASVDYTTGATSDYDLTWDLSTDNVQSGTKLGNGSAQWFDANGIFRIDGRDATSANSGIVVDARGDAYLELYADRSSDTELENAYVFFSQDATAVQSVIGTVGGANVDSQNNTFTGMGNNGFGIHHKFATGTISLGVNGSTGLTIDDNDRVYIGQDRTGYFTAVTGNYGSVQVDGADGSSGTWTGYSIGGRLVLMDNAGTTTTNRGGLYDDLNNIWAMQYNTGGTGASELSLYYNGTITAETTVVTAADFGTGMKVLDGGSTFRPVGFNVVPVYEIDASDTFDLAHNGMMWHKDAGAAVTFTCANDANIPVGATYLVHNDDTEDLTIAQGTGVTIYWLDATGAPASGNVTVSQGGIVTVYKYTDTEFWVWGAKDPITDFGADGTMDSGTDLAWSDASQPWLTLDSTSSGDNWSAQGAGISVGESGKKGSAAIHMTYNGDGSGYIGMGTVDNTAGTGGRPAFGHFDFTYNNANILVGGLLYPGTSTPSVQSTRYISDPTGQYGSIAVFGELGAYRGYAIGAGDIVLMSNGTTHGIYDDINNDWWMQFTENAQVSLYHNGGLEARTQQHEGSSITSGMEVYDHAGTLRDVGFNHVKEIAQTTGSITLDNTHAGCIIRRTGTSSVSVTMQAGTTEFPVGSMCTVLNHGTSGTYTISDGSEAMYIMDGSGAVTDSTGFTLAIGGAITIWRQGASAYYVWGTGIP